MSSESSVDLKGYYFVVHCSNGKKESRFAQLRKFLLSVISGLMFRLRRKFSKIIINGKPLCKEPDNLPLEIRKLSFKQLKRIKESLSDFENEPEKIRFTRPGYLAPPPSPCPIDEDIDIEIIYAGEEVFDTETRSVPDIKTSTTELYDEHTDNDTEEDNSDTVTEERRVPKRARPKAARGRRPDTVIPPYVIIDEEAAAMVDIRKRKRPKAAKGERKMHVDHPIDLPTEVLIERFRSDEKKNLAKTRQRPMAPRPRYCLEQDDTYFDAQVDELLKIIPVMNEKPESRMEMNSKETNEIKSSVIMKKIDEEEEEEEEEREYLFGVPYLPKSQRKFANTSLTLPWMN